MLRTHEIAEALQAVIFTGNWDLVGEMADEVSFVDCLRCFAAPRLLWFDDETRICYLNLFCASCWYTHVAHWIRTSNSQRRSMTNCPDCNIVGFIQTRS